jgi:hypothetical protein
MGLPSGFRKGQELFKILKKEMGVMESFKEFVSLSESVLSIGDIFKRSNKEMFIKKAIAGELEKEGGGRFDALSSTDPLIKHLESTNERTPETIKFIKTAYNVKSMKSLNMSKDKNGFSNASASNAPKLSNKGDVSEGIVGIALYMKFSGMAMNESTHNKILYNLTSGQPLSTNYKGSKDDLDTVTLTINLASVHFDSLTNKDPEFETLRRPLIEGALEYANSRNVNTYKKHFHENGKMDGIDIRADGLGDQKGTKTDIYVELTRTVNSITKTRRLNLNISLKAGSVGQFSQVSGSKFENQESLWKTFGMSINSVKTKYEELLSKGKQASAIELSYKTVYNQLKTDFAKSPDDITSIISLMKAIIHHATSGEHIELVQLDKRTFKRYGFKKSESKLINIAKNHNFTVSWNVSKGTNGINLPRINILLDNEPFLSVRSKQDIRANGSFYARNYIEKRPAFTRIFQRT